MKKEKKRINLLNKEKVDIAELDGIEKIAFSFYLLYLHFVSIVLVYRSRRFMFNLNQ